MIRIALSTLFIALCIISFSDVNALTLTNKEKSALNEYTINVSPLTVITNNKWNVSAYVNHSCSALYLKITLFPFKGELFAKEDRKEIFDILLHQTPITNYLSLIRKNQNLIVVNNKCRLSDLRVVHSVYYYDHDPFYFFYTDYEDGVEFNSMNYNPIFDRIDDLLNEIQEKHNKNICGKLNRINLIPADMVTMYYTKCKNKYPKHLRDILQANCRKNTKEEIIIYLTLYDKFIDGKLPKKEIKNSKDFTDRIGAAYGAGQLLGTCHHIGADIPFGGSLSETFGLIDEDYTKFYDNKILAYMSLYWAKAHVISKKDYDETFNWPYYQRAMERGMPIKEAINHVRRYGVSTKSISFYDKVATNLPKRIEVKKALNEYLLLNCGKLGVLAGGLRSAVKENIYRSFLAQVRAEEGWCVVRSGASTTAMRVGNVYDMTCKKKGDGELICNHKTQLFFSVSPSIPAYTRMLNDLPSSRNTTRLRKNSYGKWYVYSMEQ